jgi:methionine-rich copper-binding protein CopC
MKKLLAYAALMLATASAFAHARLQSSAPANDATVTTPPTEIRLQYNEAVEVAMSSVKLIGPGDAVIATDKVAADQADDKALVLPLPKLAPGAYRAEWVTMGHDGHHTKGSIRFTVK